ncbi:MAG TPA: hypothetical protein VLW26_06105 [Steroidobacteraceae bacterium]|nr:hypothetical protein [Steroidobacteraceae bacterium]
MEAASRSEFEPLTADPIPASSAAAATVPPRAPAPPAKPVVRDPPASVAPIMDRDFIARNQIVERYLSGKLPIRGATDFERFCKDNPEMLDELGLPERVHAGLRLLEASGKPEPWQEPTKKFWENPIVPLGLAGFALLLLIVSGILAGTNASKTHKIAVLTEQVRQQPLDPATSTRTIRLLPSRSGASSAPALTIGGGAAQLVDLKIDVSHSAYREFRVTIDRVDQGRVAVIHNLLKDSNGHLRLALNSSALGPGNYLLTIEGLTWRGDPEPDSWITIGVQR